MQRRPSAYTRARRRALGVSTVAALGAMLMLLTGCGGSAETAAPGLAPSSAASSAPPTATPAPSPDDGDCYRLGYDQAVSPTADVTDSVGCRSSHSAETYATGTIDDLAGGHLLAVDSSQVQSSVATTCPDELGRFVGGTEDQQRLSMLQSVWFTPTVAESDQGADWYRCDVVALAGNDRLTDVDGTLEGVLATSEGRDRYGMCATAEPGSRGFSHVACSQTHSWKAISVVHLEQGDYPGVAAVKSAGQSPCSAAGRQVAADPLDYKWSYEWPTAEQWTDGQTYGRCWAPSTS